MLRCCKVLLTIASLTAAPAWADDWPQFLGPDRNATVPDAKKLAKEWSFEGPKVLWEVAVGQGFGGAAIYKDSVFLIDRDGTKSDVVKRLRLADGQEVWSYSYDAEGKLSHPGSRSTPASRYIRTSALVRKRFLGPSSANRKSGNIRVSVEAISADHGIIPNIMRVSCMPTDR